jgi:NADH-ubiquinone oxidoreductase chain 6
LPSNGNTQNVDLFLIKKMKIIIMNNLLTNFNLEFITSIIITTSILCGIFVIISKNPIVSVLFLIGLFSSIAVYLIILGINFIGLSYLLVYVGAVSILFLFILMLINIRISELTTETNRSIPLAFIVSIAFNYAIIQLLPYSILEFKGFNIMNLYNNKTLINIKETYFTSINNWDNNITDINDITSIGNIIYTNYSIWLIIASIILLLAMVGAIVITRKQVNISIYNNDKSYPNVLKSKIKAISISMIALLENSNNKDITSYNFKFNINDILNSIIGNKSTVNITTSAINDIDVKSDIILADTIKSNINFDLINKINTKININPSPINKIDLISQETAQYINIDLESKLQLANYLHWNIDNHVLMSVHHLITNYPFHCLLPIMMVTVTAAIAITHPDSTDSTKNTTSTNIVTNTDNTTVITVDNTSTVNTSKINTCGAGGSGGEDPNRNRKVFFLLKDKTKIPVPYAIYKEYIDNLDMFIKARTSLKDKLHLLRNKIGDYLSEGGKLSLTNQETGEINEDMQHFLDMTKDDRIGTIELINQFYLWQIGLEESMNKVADVHPDINDNFKKSIDLLNIGVHEMSYYSLDNDLFSIIEENIGILFSIVDISTYATSFDMAYNPSTSSSANPTDPFTFDQLSSLDNMNALWDVSELLYDTNLDSDVLYDSEYDKWKGDSDQDSSNNNEK